MGGGGALESLLRIVSRRGIARGNIPRLRLMEAVGLRAVEGFSVGARYIPSIAGYRWLFFFLGGGGGGFQRVHRVCTRDGLKGLGWA